MSALARILLSKNIQVSGSDLSSNRITDNLVKAGANIYIGHKAECILPDMTVVYNSQVKEDNPEYAAAIALKCPILHRSDLLLQLMNDYKTLTVTGSHGKTTTSSLLSAALIEGGAEPGYAIGGIAPQLQSNGGIGNGTYFVAEADESDGSFLKYHSWGAIVTNIDNDHMDFYKTNEALERAFRQFIQGVSNKNYLFWCADDPRLAALKPEGISYGFSPHCKLRLSDFKQNGWKIIFSIHFEGREYQNIETALIGKHNALNAAAVFGLALRVGIPESSIRKALSEFQGVERRCEVKGSAHGVLVIDDYAHHPAEIQATLKAVRESIHEKKLIVVFQPHRYTRTQECMSQFKTAFAEADEVFIPDIYAASEVPIPGITSQNIVKEILTHSKTKCSYLPPENMAENILTHIRCHDVVMTLGAGDITFLGKEILSLINKSPPPKIKVGIIYGGCSSEHDISLMSARQILTALNRDYYEITEFAITREGQWLTGCQAREILDQQTPAHECTSSGLIEPSVFQALSQCDVFFPALHGRFGEDGTIQGFFEMIGKPYVGCDHRAAAVCMDKALTKKLMLVNAVGTLPFVDCDYNNWKLHPDWILTRIHAQLHMPVFVKPVHLGSSVGVVKVETDEELIHAINKTFEHDNHVIIENGVTAREIEFAVLGNRWVKAFPPGEIFSHGKMYDYGAKYGPHAILAEPRAELSQDILDEGRFLAETAYTAAGCSGLARVDFFLDSTNSLWLNEINPLPGFTNKSLYPRMCEANGLPMAELLDWLIILAFERARQMNLWKF